MIDKENIIKKFNVYPSTSLMLRLLFDLAAANIGMFMGSIITMMVWMYRWPATSQTFFWEFFHETWFANIPLLSLACLFGFTVSGLYGVSRKDDYRKIIAIVGRSLLAAFLVHTLLIYAAGFKLSRTMFASGWFFITLLILCEPPVAQLFFQDLSAAAPEGLQPRPGEDRQGPDHSYPAAGVGAAGGLA